MQSPEKTPEAKERAHFSPFLLLNFPFYCICIFFSAVAGIIYLLYALAYAIIFGWEEWGKKMNVAAAKRREAALARENQE